MSDSNRTKPEPAAFTLDYASGLKVQRTPSDPLAVASALAGLLLCVPVVAGGLAIGLGVMVLKDASRSKNDGHLAAAGIVLGSINLLLTVWLLVAHFVT